MSVRTDRFETTEASATLYLARAILKVQADLQAMDGPERREAEAALDGLRVEFQTRIGRAP